MHLSKDCSWSQKFVMYDYSSTVVFDDIRIMLTQFSPRPVVRFANIFSPPTDINALSNMELYFFFL